MKRNSHLSAHQKLQATTQLREALAKIIPSDRVDDWFWTPNPAFENQTPLRVIERGGMDRLWRMIFQIEAGVAS